MTIPARMSFEDAARSCEASDRRYRRKLREERAAAAKRDMLGPWPLSSTQSPFAAADLTRLVLDWAATNMSPDQEMRGSARRLRARARDLIRNNSYAASYMNMVSVNVLGAHGFKHQAMYRNADGELNQEVNDKIEEAFDRWSESVSADGRFSLLDLEELELKAALGDGESFLREWTGPDFPCSYALEPIDADQISEESNRRRTKRDNEIRMGVEVNEFGRPVAYHLQDPYAVSMAKSQRIPAELMIHLARFRRVNQTRGVTQLGPTMIALKMLDGYEEAELVAARAAAAKMGFFQSKNDLAAGSMGPDDSTVPITMNAAPGTLEQLPVGWEFKEWSPDHPTAAFAAFVKNCLRKVATGLGVSYNALASDLEGVNYSSMRSGLLIERETWRRLQSWWVQAFRNRIYRKWIVGALTSRELVLDGLIPFKERENYAALSSVRWVPRGYPWVDPLKDGQATVLAVANGLASRTDALAEQGIEFDEVLDQLADEAKKAKQKGVQIEGGLAGVVGDQTDTTTNDGGSDTPNGNGNGRAHQVAHLARLLDARRR